MKHVIFLLFATSIILSILVIHDAEAATGTYMETGTKLFIGIGIIVVTIIVIVLFSTNDYLNDKWHDATSYQKLLSIGIGVPLWIAVFGVLIGDIGSWVAGGSLLFTFAVIVSAVSRWKRRSRIESDYKKYFSQSSQQNSSAQERTYYKETDYENDEYSYGRQEDSFHESQQSEYEEEHEEEYQEETAEELDLTLKRCYEILDVNESTPPAEIKKAYKRLVKQWHPDSHLSPERKQIAENEMKKINYAYETLEKAGKVK